MDFLLNILIGILIGAGAILPGISSGVFCVIFGIYEKLINSIVTFFSDFKQNIKFLLPLGIGGIIGVIFFSKIISYFFTNYNMQASFVFIGLILGTIPSLFKQASTNKFLSAKHILIFIFSFLIGIGLIIIEKNFNFNINGFNSQNLLLLIISGFIMSVGIIVPGISNTILLMLIGIYSTYLEAISSVNLSILIPMGIGILVGSLLWIYIMKVLLKKHHTATFYSIIGFTLGSIFVLYPGFSFNMNGIISILLMTISILVSYKLSYKYA